MMSCVTNTFLREFLTMLYAQVTERCLLMERYNKSCVLAAGHRGACVPVREVRR